MRTGDLGGEWERLEKRLGSHSTARLREERFGAEEEEYWPVSMRARMILKTFILGYELNAFDVLRASPVKI